MEKKNNVLLKSYLHNNIYQIDCIIIAINVVTLTSDIMVDINVQLRDF